MTTLPSTGGSIRHVVVAEKGVERRFSIASRIEQFETINGSAYAALQSIVAGSWLHSSVRNVLAWAHPDGFVAGNAWFERHHRDRDVADLLVVAGKVLQAALHGLDPADARVELA